MCSGVIFVTCSSQFQFVEVDKCLIAGPAGSQRYYFLKFRGFIFIGMVFAFLNIWNETQLKYLAIPPFIISLIEWKCDAFYPKPNMVIKVYGGLVSMQEEDRGRRIWSFSEDKLSGKIWEQQ